MAYTEELQRLMEAKASMRQSIINKGVDVPEDAPIEDYAGYIRQIADKPIIEWTLPESEFGVVEYQVAGDTEKTLYYIKDATDFAKLGNTSANVSANIKFTGITLAKSEITGFRFGTSKEITSTPNHFCYFLKSLTKLEGIESTNLTTIDTSFAEQCVLMSSDLFLPETVTTIGDAFLSNCTAFDGEVTLPESLSTIGIRFLFNCSSFSHSLTVPSSLTAIGGNFLSGCNNFTGRLNCMTTTHPTDNYTLGTSSATAAMYTSGVKLSGGYAQDWKDGLPDRTSSPYRKLTVAIGPDNPTLADLKLTLATDNPASIYPVGTEIPDTYDGNDNPLIVAQYLDETNNSAYGGAVGVILIRKYVEPTNQAFGLDSDDSVDYVTSDIKSFLDTTYLDKSSNELKTSISDINVPYYDGSSMTSVTSKFFLMSSYEVCGGTSFGKVGYEGIMWNYWKKKTGLSSPGFSANEGRIMMTRKDGSAPIWLRSRYDRNYVCEVDDYGDVTYNITTRSQYGVLPACFIAKG